MRRTVSALLVGSALLATAMTPVAAGADPAPFKHPKARLHLTCKATREADQPAVACKWEQRPAERPMPAGVRYRLWRVEKAKDRHVHVVYRGRSTSFVDTGVERGYGYLYRVQVVDAAGETVARSNVAAVRVRGLRPEPERPACEDRFSTASRTPADECHPSDAAPEPTPKPIHPDKPPTPVDPPSADPPKDTLSPPVKPADKPAHKPADEPYEQPSEKPADKPSEKPADKPDRPDSAEREHPVKSPHPGQPADPEAKAKDRPAPKPAERPSSPGPRPAQGPVGQLQLACEPVRDYGDVAETVKCEWTAIDGAAGYRLWRAERNDREVVFETTEATSYLDADVEAGHGYLYLVQALDANGEVIGRSHPVKAAPPSEAKNETR